MNDSSKLLNILDLERIDDTVYRGDTLDIGSFAVYGGQVLAQAVVAAYHHASENKTLHSCHAYFLHPGKKDLPIDYHIEIAKKGRSFDVVRVLAKQNDSIIFILASSFHIAEEGIAHQMGMPNVLPPEKLTSFTDLFDLFNEYDIKPKGMFSTDAAFDFKPVEVINPFDPGTRPPSVNTWFKFNGSEPVTNFKLKQALTTYASDFNLLITALLPHGMSFFKTPMQIASLDHALWFHAEPDLDDYMLYSVESPMAAGARASAHGKIFTRKGKLVASVVQEGLIRKI